MIGGIIKLKIWYQLYYQGPKNSAISNLIGDEHDFAHKKPSEIQLINEIKTLKKEVVFLDNIST